VAVRRQVPERSIGAALMTSVMGVVPQVAAHEGWNGRRDVHSRQVEVVRHELNTPGGQVWPITFCHGTVNQTQHLSTGFRIQFHAIVAQLGHDPLDCLLA